MSDVLSMVRAMRRPRLLIQAAKAGLVDYNRAKILKKFAKITGDSAPDKAIQSLLPVEESLETARQAGDASYSPARHVEVFIASLVLDGCIPRFANDTFHRIEQRVVGRNGYIMNGNDVGML